VIRDVSTDLSHEDSITTGRKQHKPDHQTASQVAVEPEADPSYEHNNAASV